MTVSDIARTKVVTVQVGATIEEIVTEMTEVGVGSVVVLEDEEPVGIITDRDLVLRVFGAGLDPTTVTAEEVMTDELVTATGEEGVYELVRMMAQNGVRRVPVVADGELTGIVTLDDVIILLSMEIQSIETLIRSESPPFEVPAAQLPD
ncbi:MAG: CBS domain-containing protein [Halobacteriales archaeon]|nr:CBS domain-containing protein [Halobacteriales archaeon]